MKEPLRQFDQICNQIAETGMLNGRERVICGLSGGADSVFLFLALCELKERFGFTLRACHVHHGIRGEEADRDASFVKKIAEDAGVPLRIFMRNVPAEAKERGRSLEEAGREARYECYLECAGEWRSEPGEEGRSGEVAIALAHHENDLAESVLFHLSRGCGVHGLAPMRPVSRLDGNTVVLRPLLGFSRKEIESSLVGRGVRWVEDSTNAGDDAARNRIRHEILPLLAEEVNSAAVRHISGTALRLADVSDFLLAEGRRRAGFYLSSGRDGLFVSERVMDEMPAMQGEIIRLAFHSASGKMRDVGSVHIRDILSLFQKEKSKELCLPHSTYARRVEGGILLGQRSEKKEDSSGGEEHPLLIGGSARIQNWRIFAARETSPKEMLTEKRYTKTVDYGKMKNTLVVRYRRKGDFLTVRSDGARKTLSDYFTDEKVPRAMRDRIPVVADGSEIVWVVGMRIGYKYRITGDTSSAVTLTALSGD